MLVNTLIIVKAQDNKMISEIRAISFKK